MKSTIKIDFTDNGKGLEPFIKASVVSSDDMKDKMLSTFFECLGGTSSWLRVEFRHLEHNDPLAATQYNIHIYAVKPDEVPDMIEKAKERIG